MNRASSLKLEQQNVRPDLAALQRWVLCFCIIKFDLERGQEIEECFPPGVLSKEEESNVAFSSFPDSISNNENRSSIHDCMYFFRIRRRADDVASPRFKRSPVSSSSHGTDSGSPRAFRKFPSSGHTGSFSDFVSDDDPSTSSPVRLSKSSSSPVSSPRFRKSLLAIYKENAEFGSRNSGGNTYLYGYVFNRQRHDERLKRGGEQKSVVILSCQPYSSVFKPLLQILGPLCFDIGKKALYHIATFVSRWPSPIHGELMDLPIGNASLKAHLPPAHSLPAECGSSDDEFVSSVAPFLPTNQPIPQGLFHDADLFGIFRGILMRMWMLWELLIIGDPVLLIAPTPPQCCEAVAGLVSLIAPLPCSIDFRPFFTIQDPDFKHINYLKEGDQFPPMILGVTNLYFLKSLENIPHVVSVGTPALSSSKSAVSSNYPNGRSVKHDQSNLRGITSKLSPSNIINAVKMKREGPLSLMTMHKEDIWSTYQPTTKPDTTVLNRLVDAGLNPRVEESMLLVNNDILRRHFLELTTNFLSPFGPYFNVVTPSKGTSPFSDPPPLPQFHTQEFLENLAKRGPGKFLSKRMNNNWLDLYRLFLKGQNFSPWFQRRRAAAEQEQQRLWRDTRLGSDIQQFISKMSELQIVDCFHSIEKHIQIENELIQSGKGGADSIELCTKMKRDLHAVFDVLPEDVQELMLLTPRKAALLQDKSI